MLILKAGWVKRLGFRVDIFFYLFLAGVFFWLFLVGVFVVGFFCFCLFVGLCCLFVVFFFPCDILTILCSIVCNTYTYTWWKMYEPSVSLSWYDLSIRSVLNM